MKILALPPIFKLCPSFPVPPVPQAENHVSECLSDEGEGYAAGIS